MKKLFFYKRIYLIILIPISIALTLVARNNLYFAENIYAKHIYKGISQPISTIFGLVPFSVAEVIIFVFPVACLIWVIAFIIRLVRFREKRKQIFLKGLLNILCLVSVILFLYTMLAGINYYRATFSTYSNLEIRESPEDELYALTKSLALQANEFRDKTTARDGEGVFQLSLSYYETAALANEAFTSLSKEYPILGGSYAPPKPVMLSRLMSYAEITGIFFPFTTEANVNVDIPDYNIPVTMLHELAHLRGFMREDEANFIAYLAGMESGNADLNYSSTMLALVIAGNALYEQNPDLYFSVRELYSEGVIRDIRANSTYWQQYDDTAVSTISNHINDTYLKANAQEDGVKSYGRMLDLLLAKFRKDHSEN
ncbi:MAG TPA: DUF3810 domain-containing protein [Clostridiales bacterium]|nr:DUF3810 domain-containing protein [Clostridiales bacterium]